VHIGDREEEPTEAPFVQHLHVLIKRTCRFELWEAFLGFLGFFSRFVGVVMEWNYGILGLGVEIGLLCVIYESYCVGQL
jgi:hypothetical protein